MSFALSHDHDKSLVLSVFMPFSFVGISTMWAKPEAVPPTGSADFWDDSVRFRVVGFLINSPAFTYGPVICIKSQKGILMTKMGREVRPQWWLLDCFLAWNPAADVSWFYFCGVLGTANDFRLGQGLWLFFFSQAAACKVHI